MNSLLSLVVLAERHERTRLRHDLLALADAALALAQPVARPLDPSRTRPVVTTARLENHPVR